MAFVKKLIIFLIINFGALALGVLLMNDGPQSSWYKNLNQAPWTPPGWFFGVAWTTIMICFSIYLAFLVGKVDKTKFLTLFGVQFFLNVIWNYIFFNQHVVGVGLISIIALTIIVGKFLFDYRTVLKAKSWLIAPYFIWLCIACSLNAYILFNN